MMKKLFLVVVTLSWAVAAQAALLSPAEVRFVLNQNVPGAGLALLGTQVVDKSQHVVMGKYDIAVSGGLSDTFQLKDVDGKNVVIPANAIISDCVIDVITTLSAHPAATKFQINLGSSAGAIKGVTTADAASGLIACIPVGSVATSIKTSAETSASISITAGQLEAGELNVMLKYILSE